MPLAHVTQTGNVSIPKLWRDELGIGPNSRIIMEKKDDKIIIEPLRKKDISESLKKIDNEMKRKKIIFTMDEAVKDDLYD
jgi:AbrB family looped-hinge helix DNA binding protein